MPIKKEVTKTDDKGVEVKQKVEYKRDQQTGFYYIYVDGVKQDEAFSNLSATNNEINRIEQGVK